MFFAVTKGHQADIGNAIPSTYAPTARDMFEEGAIDWPCIKVQRDYKDVADIIKIAQMHNRVPEMWYGDYLACVGSRRSARSTATRRSRSSARRIRRIRRTARGAQAAAEGPLRVRHQGRCHRGRRTGDHDPHRVRYASRGWDDRV